MSQGDNPYTIFGYGSLIWKPPPHTIKRTPGYLKGYVRRFAQSSHDHRGTPDLPGRVVTLIHHEDWNAFSQLDPFPHDDVVWGVVYTIDPQYEEEVRAYLDHREKDGYTLETVDVHHLQSGQEYILQASCYVGRSDNPSFIGSEPIDQLAEHIWRSEGPSGPNKEYLYELSKAVKELAPEAHDSHLSALEERCQEMDRQEVVA